MKPSFKQTFIALLALSFVTGCQTADDADEFSRINALADTLYSSNAELEILLTDYNGGWYYESAMGLPTYAEYGWRIGSSQLLSGWLIKDIEGNLLNETGTRTIIHPAWFERQYESGLTITVATGYKQNQLLLTISPPRHSKRYLFQPLVPLSQHEKVDGKQLSKQVSEIKLDDARMLIQTDRKAKFAQDAPSDSRQTMVFRQGDLTGRRARETYVIPVSLQLKGKTQLLLSIQDGNAAMDSFKEEYAEFINARQMRLQHLDNILALVDIECPDTNFSINFDRARLMFDSMLPDYQHQLTAIPFKPYTDKWSTLLALPGLTALDRSPDRAYAILGSVIEDTALASGSNIPLIDGLSIVTFEKLNRAAPPPNPDLEVALRESCEQTLKTITEALSVGSFEISVGLLESGKVGGLRDGLFLPRDPDSHFLHDNDSALPRNGALIEDQVLLGKIRGFLSDESEDAADLDIPEQVVKGVSHWYRKGRSEYAPRALTASGTFMIPLQTQRALNFFHNFRENYWYDRLEFQPGQKHPVGVEVHTIAPILALEWYKPGNARYSEELLANAQKNGLLGAVGFRSLASTDTNYSDAHIYNTEGDLRGTTSRGDLLVWTVGRLADMYMLTDSIPNFHNLIDNLDNRLDTYGIFGALHEAENGAWQTAGDNITANRADIISTAEYVRIVSNHLLGLPIEEREVVKLKPQLPPGWTSASVEFAYAGGRIHYAKVDSATWEFSQSGIDPEITLSFEFIPPSHPEDKKPPRKAVWAKRMKDGEAFRVIFRRTERGAWIAEDTEL